MLAFCDAADERMSGVETAATAIPPPAPQAGRSLLRRRATHLGVVHSERPAKGGHVVVRHGGRATTVPMHRGDMPTGTFRAILRQLGLSNADLEH
jgi:mRNA interferase HicA